jgi:hypothetical protein
MEYGPAPILVFAVTEKSYVVSSSKLVTVRKGSPDLRLEVKLAALSSLDTCIV